MDTVVQSSGRLSSSCKVCDHVWVTVDARSAFRPNLRYVIVISWCRRSFTRESQILFTASSECTCGSSSYSMRRAQRRHQIKYADSDMRMRYSREAPVRGRPSSERRSARLHPMTTPYVIAGYVCHFFSHSSRQRLQIFARGVATHAVSMCSIDSTGFPGQRWQIPCSSKPGMCDQYLPTRWALCSAFQRKSPTFRLISLRRSDSQIEESVCNLGVITFCTATRVRSRLPCDAGRGAYACVARMPA